MAQSTLAFSGEATPSTFNFGTHEVRIVMRDGEPWFVATDVAEALGYRNAPDAARNLGEHQKASTQIVRSTSGGNPNVTIINESGLYRLVLRSRKPEAEKFSDWVTGEVLPSIRKTGRYEKPGREETIQETVARLAAQVEEGKDCPPGLFLPLIKAVERKMADCPAPAHQFQVGDLVEHRASDGVVTTGCIVAPYGSHVVACGLSGDKRRKTGYLVDFDDVPRRHANLPFFVYAERLFPRSTDAKPRAKPKEVVRTEFSRIDGLRLSFPANTNPAALLEQSSCHLAAAEGLLTPLAMDYQGDALWGIYYLIEAARSMLDMAIDVLPRVHGEQA